jgi:hypothetical protein
MKVPSAEAIVQLMVASDPRQTAYALLEFLLHANGARTGAIFAVDGGVRLVVGHSIDQDALDWTSPSWSRSQGALRQGRLSRSDDRSLLPVLRGDRLIALVYLGAGHVDMDSVAELSPLIGEAVIRAAHSKSPASATVSIDSYLGHASAQEIERRKLCLLLDRHEWNVARVARELQVTRTTVYKRLASLGIARKRVPKGSFSAVRGSESSFEKSQH